MATYFQNSSPPTSANKPLAALLFFGWLFACMDQANISLGGLHVKIAFIVFPIYLFILLFNYGFKIYRSHLGVGLVFLVLLVPSVIGSVSPLHSFAFLIGACVCVCTMLGFSMMAARLGPATIDVMVLFYRFSVLMTLPLVALGIQERGSFTFYEPSYYAVALIPYFCITFYRLSVGGARAAAIDCFTVLAAVIASKSFSMALWSFVAFLWMRVIAKKLRPIQLLAVFGIIAALFSLACLFDSRTQAAIEIFRDASADPEWFANIAIHLAGNRVQRVYMAWDIACSHTILGVGLGVFKNYTTNFLGYSDYSIMGISASDFEVETNAVCIYLEILAETGILGASGFLLLLFRIYRTGRSRAFVLPMVIAFLLSMISLVIESSYLRPYIWALYGTILGLSRCSFAGSPSEFFLPYPRLQSAEGATGKIL
jgi:hypothetical protein